MFRPSSRLCNACSSQLLTLFNNGFAHPARVSKYGGKFLLRKEPPPLHLVPSRLFTAHSALRAPVDQDEISNEDSLQSPAQKEAIVRQARQTFGETLPKNFLSNEEYQLYERLYGPPSAITLPEDVDLLKGFEGEQDEVTETAKPNVLMREDEDGKLEEVIFQEDPDDEMEDNEEETGIEKISHGELEIEFTDEEIIMEMERLGKQTGPIEEDEAASIDPETEKAFQARMKKLHDSFTASKMAPEAPMADEQSMVEEKPLSELMETSLEEREEIVEESEDEDNEYDRNDSARAHPLTSAGHFGTSPSTINLPKESLVDPITAILADVSNKHLTEVAQKTFGGPALPYSTATMRRPNLLQQTIPLEASQGRMGEMESNAYLAAIYPGAYASITSTLIEVRKRLGSDWLRGLMSQPSGPRILDAGSGGAAVLAWREVIQAEYEAIHPSASPETRHIPLGKSTVVTGSHTLRQHASALLDNTTFIPRLPDYDPSRDHPSLEASNPQPRKQYDIIVAPYTLWSLREDHMRKSQIQNFWSLLDPHSGVLILIEKGVPRGFELIADARDTLLKHHISSPGSEEVIENAVDSVNPNRFTSKEEGMIIAPCTNHGKCPMYITAGKSQGRKDFCHFNQRFIRPPYLQRILGQTDKNHEDISFSYVAFQRGRDLRKYESIIQGKAAADAAFEGYEDHDNDNDNNNGGQEHHGNSKGTTRPPPPSLLNMPRAILPPIKRRGHVILDLCTPAGKIERWTVPKSFSKQAYRDARKSKWGDLWALGAKTRVGRNVRIGLKKKTAMAAGGRGKGKRRGGDDDGDGDEGEEEMMMEEDAGAGDDDLGDFDDSLRSSSSGMKKGKKRTTAKDRKGRSGRAKYPAAKKESSSNMEDEN